ncbi:hypothetical protein C3L33_19549, partial [Rhododendron williamsianum]
METLALNLSIPPLKPNPYHTHLPKYPLSLSASQIHYLKHNKRNLSLTITCKLKATRQSVEREKGGVAGNISASEGAPLLSEDGNGGGNSAGGGGGKSKLVKKLWRRVLSVLVPSGCSLLRIPLVERIGIRNLISGVFLKGPSLYAFKGLAGRFAPIGVHLAMLLIMVGGTLTAAGSFKGSVTVPQGLNFIVGDVLGPNRLEPLSSVNDEGPFNLAMAPLKINGDKKLYGTFLPVGSPDSPDLKGISMLARDLQSIVLYDLEGKFAGIRRPNSKLPIDIDGHKIVVVDAIGSTGLDLKTDPGVPVVYAGFGFLMLTTCISFLSHSQRHQDGKRIAVSRLSSRDKIVYNRPPLRD